LTSATLVRDPFRYRYQQSPAGELSDKVIHTLRRNLDSYVRKILDNLLKNEIKFPSRVLDHGIAIIHPIVIPMDI
jgi:hypothetical protein